MKYDFTDLKQETINYKGVILENLFVSLVSDELPCYLATHSSLLC